MIVEAARISLLSLLIPLWSASASQETDRMLGRIAALASKEAMTEKHSDRLNSAIELSKIFASIDEEYGRLGLAEKCQFTLSSLVLCSFDGELELVFVQHISRHDGKLVARQLAHLSSQRLQSDFGLSDERIKQIRAILRRIEEYPTR